MKNRLIILKSGEIAKIDHFIDMFGCYRVSEIEDQYGSIIRRHTYVYLREVAEIIK